MKKFNWTCLTLMGLILLNCAKERPYEEVMKDQDLLTKDTLNQMLPKEVGDDIVPLFDKVLEHHKGFSNTWQRDKESGDPKILWALLKEDHQRRVELGSDFKEMIGRLQTQYYAQ